MAVEFSKSETKLNLMKAFAGESQARNRYTFAASLAKKSNLYVIEAVFKFTADQEKDLPDRLKVAVEAMCEFVLAGAQSAMCKYNNK